MRPLYLYCPYLEYILHFRVRVIKVWSQLYQKMLVSFPWPPIAPCVMELLAWPARPAFPLLLFDMTLPFIVLCIYCSSSCFQALACTISLHGAFFPLFFTISSLPNHSTLNLRDMLTFSIWSNPCSAGVLEKRSLVFLLMALSTISVLHLWLWFVCHVSVNQKLCEGHS